MIQSWIKRITITLLFLSLSACSLLEQWHHRQHRGDNVRNLERRIYVNSVQIPATGAGILDLKNNRRQEFNSIVDDLIDIEDSVDKIDNRDLELGRFSRLFGENQDPRFSSGIGDFVQKIESRISGPGGFAVRLFIHYFFVCSDDELRSLGTLKVVGKIKNWLYDQKATVTTDGINGDKGSGLTFWEAEAKDCKGVNHSYKFHIAVDEAYELWENLAEGAELEFASNEINEMIPEHEKIKNVEENRRFDYKLHARGNKIHVLSVFLDDNLVDASDPIYVSDADSCIDLFFEGEIGATDLPVQSDYCMGRCDEPPIINTGGGG